MNKIILKRIKENKEYFVPHIISKKQFIVIEKVLTNEKLTKTEYGYLYNGIKKKMSALNLITEKEKPAFYLYNPQNIILDRKQKAISLLSGLKSKGIKAFISGSFLFSERYNDIDIFIMSNKHKEEYRENLHYIYIKQKDLEKPVFNSAAKSCISNFDILLPRIKIKKLHFGQILNSYQELIINILEGEDMKNLKDIIADYSLHNLKKMLDSHGLNREYKKLVKRKDKINLISKITKELLLNNFNKDYLIIRLKRYIKTLEEDIKNIKLNDHLKIYKKTYEEIISECRAIKK